MYTYKAKLIRVINGDTVVAEVDLGFNVFVRQRIKLFGIDTPDSKSNDPAIKELGLESKAKLLELLTREFVVETILNKRGKVGRVLGIVFAIASDGSLLNINDTLVNQGHAVGYSLGK